MNIENLNQVLTLVNANKPDIRKILGLCPQKLCVEFALHCGEDLDKYYDFKKYPDVYKTRQKCLKLVADWLIDSSKVSRKELDTAASAAYAAANAAAVQEQVVFLKSLILKYTKEEDKSWMLESVLCG